MESATRPIARRARDRCEPRARRLGQVKFVPLVLEPGIAPPARPHSPPPARLYRRVQAFLSRVCERLVSARP